MSGDLLWSGKAQKRIVRNGFGNHIATVQKTEHDGRICWEAILPSGEQLSAEPFERKTDAMQAVIDANENGELG